MAEREQVVATATRSLPVILITPRTKLDQRFLLRLAQSAPYARTWHRGTLTTHIFNFADARRLLSVHESNLATVSFSASHLFPHGTLREMEGEPHEHHRRVFAAGLRTVSVAANLELIEAICGNAAQTLAALRIGAIDDLATILEDATSQIALRLLFGLEPNDPRFAALITIYRGVAIRHLRRTFTAERLSQILAIAGPLASENRPGLLQNLARANNLDDTALGNLALLGKIASHDIAGLWCWLLKLLGDNPAVQRSLRGKTGTEAIEYSQAVILEALRLERSEYLHRRALSEIVFDGLLIPGGSDVKIAVWEAHKDPEHFPEPFAFDPARFLGHRPPPDHYAPLGIGHHGCLGIEWTVGASAAFVRQLTRVSQLQIVADGRVRHRDYHFAPSKQLRIRFDPLTQQPSA